FRLCTRTQTVTGQRLKRVSSFLSLLCFFVAKQSFEEPYDDGPRRAEGEWRGGDGFRVRFTGLNRVRWLRVVRDFQMLFDARRELPEYLPRDFLNHAASELDDLSDQIDVSANRNLRPTAREWRDSTQHRHLRRSGTAH